MSLSCLNQTAVSLAEVPRRALVDTMPDADRAQGKSH